MKIKIIENKSSRKHGEAGLAPSERADFEPSRRKYGREWAQPRRATPTISRKAKHVFLFYCYLVSLPTTSNLPKFIFPIFQQEFSFSRG